MVVIITKARFFNAGQWSWNTIWQSVSLYLALLETKNIRKNFLFIQLVSCKGFDSSIWCYFITSFDKLWLFSCSVFRSAFSLEIWQVFIFIHLLKFHKYLNLVYLLLPFYLLFKGKHTTRSFYTTQYLLKSLLIFITLLLHKLSFLIKYHSVHTLLNPHPPLGFIHHLG